ncbi:MAG: 6-bladed beta-propeller [Candidatus Halalkalibacterium sp. M3_1C_030]
MENVPVNGEDDVAKSDTLMLDREQVFGDTDEIPIASFGAVIADRFGRVYVGDSQQQMIHIFMPDGRYLGRIGQDGDGPGEFRWVGYLEILDQQLYAYDPNGQKIILFNIGESPDILPEYVTDISIARENWKNFPEAGYMNPAFHSLQQNGDFILNSKTSPLIYRQDADSVGVSKYYRWNTSSQTQPELIFQTREAEHIVTEWFIIPPPFASKEIIAFSDNGQIYSADTREFRVRIHDSDGTYQSAF